MIADTALSHLLDAGVLGVLLVIALLAVYFLYKEVRKEQAAHMATIKEFASKDSLLNAQTKETLENILALIRGKS